VNKWTGRACVGLCLLQACHPWKPYTFGEISDTNAGSLRKYITVVEYTKSHSSRLFYDGKQTNNPPQAVYEIDSGSDLVIAFSPKIRELGGSVSVRARLMRNPVVELPVQNFTTVTDKELKKETVLLLPTQGSLFRDDKYHKDVQSQLSGTQSAATQLAGFIKLQMLPLFDQFSSGASASGFSALKTAQDKDYSTALSTLIDGINQVDTLRTSTRDKLTHLRDTIKDLFLDGEFVSDLRNDSFADMKRIAREQMDSLDELDVRLGADDTQYLKALTQCVSNPNLAYQITADTSTYAIAQDVGVKGKEAQRRLHSGDVIFAAKEDKALRILDPRDLEGMVIDPKNAVAKDRQTGVLLCAGPVLANLYQKLTSDAAAARDISVEIARPAAAAARVACETDKSVMQRVQESQPAAVSTRPPNEATVMSDAKSGISDAIDSMECIVKNDILDNLARRIHDARIRLGENELVHGDMVSVIVSISVPPIGFSRATLGSSPEPTVIEERFTLRVIDRGWSFSTRPQFALIKRQSDVQTGTDKDSPSNFKPAPGVLLNFRYRTNSRRSEWLIPSVGIAAFAVDFDPAKTFELGIGPSVGILNDFVHAGFGADLSADAHRSYFFVSLDFLKTFDTFSTLFGGGAQ